VLQTTIGGADCLNAVAQNVGGQAQDLVAPVNQCATNGEQRIEVTHKGRRGD
jgi:hypothetical protein